MADQGFPVPAGRVQGEAFGGTGWCNPGVYTAECFAPTYLGADVRMLRTRQGIGVTPCTAPARPLNRAAQPD